MWVTCKIEDCGSVDLVVQPCFSCNSDKLIVNRYNIECFDCGERVSCSSGLQVLIRTWNLNYTDRLTKTQDRLTQTLIKIGGTE